MRSLKLGRRRLRELLVDTKAFFDAEFGLAAPHVTTYIAASQADLAASFLDATGAPVSTTACAARGRNFILLYCQDDLSSIWPREYFHVLQSDLIANLESVDLTGMHWLLDGTAAHAAALYRDAREIESQDRYLAKVIASAKTQNAPLTDPAATTLHRLAIDLLVQQAGAQSLVEFWRQVGKGGDWRAAFQQAFGLSLEHFLELFEPTDPKSLYQLHSSGGLRRKHTYRPGLQRGASTTSRTSSSSASLTSP